MVLNHEQYADFMFPWIHKNCNAKLIHPQQILHRWVKDNQQWNFICTMLSAAFLNPNESII